MVYTAASNIDLQTQCHIAIPKGICCDFWPTLTQASIPKPKPPSDVTDSVCSSFNDILLNTDARSSEEEDNIVENDLSLNQEEEIQSVRQEVIRNRKRSWHQECSLDCDPLLFLQRYHSSDTKSFRTKPYSANTAKVLKDDGTQSCQKTHHDNLTMNNAYSGALYFPSHNLLIQSQACNK